MVDIKQLKQTVRDARTGQFTEPRGKVEPVSMSLSGAAGKRKVINTAKRVISTHSEVIKALAKR